MRSTTHSSGLFTVSELLVAPSALLVAVTVLRDGLAAHDPQPVSTRVPAQRKPRFVTVTRAGGRRSRFEDTAALIVQAWDDDTVLGESRAEQTANLCLGILATVAGTQVGGAQVWGWSDPSSPAWFPDPDSGIPRFQFTGQLGIKTREHN